LLKLLKVVLFTGLGVRDSKNVCHTLVRSCLS
jgi:hypothetical protein